MADATEVPVTSEPKTAAPTVPGVWSPFESLRREIDQLFDRAGLGVLRQPLARLAIDPALVRGPAPAVDLVEKAGEYEITAELPGLDEKDVEVKLANGTLTIKGEKNEEKETREKDYYLSERRFGSFVRSFRVPEGVDADKIEATFAKGVLTVKLPKTDEAQSAEKKIAVKAA